MTRRLNRNYRSLYERLGLLELWARAVYIKICDSFHVSRPLSSSGNFYGSEIRHGIFGGLNFGPGIFLGFDLSLCDHSCHLKFGVPASGIKQFD